MPHRPRPQHARTHARTLTHAQEYLVDARLPLDGCHVAGHANAAHLQARQRHAGGGTRNNAADNKLLVRSAGVTAGVACAPHAPQAHELTPHARTPPTRTHLLQLPHIVHHQRTTSSASSGASRSAGRRTLGGNTCGCRHTRSAGRLTGCASTSCCCGCRAAPTHTRTHTHAHTHIHTHAHAHTHTHTHLSAAGARRG
jgi:hypothetical protein